MRLVQPSVHQIAAPSIDWVDVEKYLRSLPPAWIDGVKVEAVTWMRTLLDAPGDMISDAEALSEFAGRRCYRSWAPGLNVNVSKVRSASADYLTNILTTGHGSVLEHGMFTFVFENVSRVFTHELVRHRPGVAISQESMRFVRLSDIPFWFPEWASQSPELLTRCYSVIEVLENHQRWMAKHFQLEDDCADCAGSGWIAGHAPGTQASEMFVTGRPDQFSDEDLICKHCGGSGRVQLPGDFPNKKFLTSFMRRFAPDGVATGIVWSANVRTLRHVITMRTELAAEEEIRLVFDEVARQMVDKYPLVFGDYARTAEGEWHTPFRKV